MQTGAGDVISHWGQRDKEERGLKAGVHGTTYPHANILTNYTDVEARAEASLLAYVNSVGTTNNTQLTKCQIYYIQCIYII